MNGPFHSNEINIQRLQLKNFRRFVELDIGFESDVTVLVAENGGGKTAVLDGIALALSPLVHAFNDKQNQGFQRTDVRLVFASGATAPIYPTELKAEGLGRVWQWSLEKMGNTKGNARKTLSALAEELRSQVAVAVEHGSTRPTLPLIAYYGTGRLWDWRRLTKLRKTAQKDLTDPTTAYLDCLLSSSSYAQFSIWFERVIREAQDEAQSGLNSPHAPTPLLTSVRRAVDIVLAPTQWNSIGWDNLRSEVVASHPTQGRIPVSGLSDGVRNVVVLVADLAHRAVRLNGHFGGSACEKTPGIVLIDEVDMHLHPSWQQRVLGLMQKAFPLVQFIVSTHSPQVLSTVLARQIRVIHDDGKVATPSFQTRGVESADVLSEVMAVDPVPALEQSKSLYQYRDLIDSGQAESDDGRRLRAELTEHFGAMHPVMVDCDRLIRFVKFRQRQAANNKD